MGKTAFLFPGQGSQAVGMGVALVENFPEARAAFEQASAVLGWDLLQACKEGPDERLRQTDVAQPALYVTGYVAAIVLRSKGIQADAFAGHSIGEYSALASANVFSFQDGISLVLERGRLMQAAGKAHPGTMAAILGMDPSAVEAICSEVRAQGICVAANFNSPEQIVIAGEAAAVQAACEKAKAQGAKRVIPLNVSGGFHSPLMAESAQAMRARLDAVTFRDASAPVAMNADGQLHQTAAEIKAQLALQLDHSVRWVQTLESLRAKGCTIFVECGAGRVLSGITRRIDKQLQVYNTDTIEALNEAVGSRQAV